MGRINQLAEKTTLNSTDVIAVDAGAGGNTNKMTGANLAGQLKTLGNYQEKLTFDSAPTAGSTNPVTSGGVKTALDGKQNTLTFDATPTAGSTNPVTSGGIATAIAQSTASGSNANGTYVKFVDGTMICYNIISQFTFTANSTRTETHNFPAAFVTAPVVTLNINTTIPDKLSLSCYGVSATQYVLNAVSTFSANQGPTVWVMAIGRWK